MGWIATAVFVAVDVRGVAVLGAFLRRPPLCVASFGLGLRLARCIRYLAVSKTAPLDNRNSQ
jgi:hypothetical protein